ncbi:MAG: DUF2846 domain-containing protein [Ferrovum sp.]|nr:DUF2846 domain-containing protein [Ferrovum sp.]
MKKRTILAALFVIVSVTGCATNVPMGAPSKDEALKTFAAKHTHAGVYIYRNEFVGPIILMNVQVDGHPLGQTGPKVYLYTEISPGKHVITSTSISQFTGNPVDETAQLEFEAVAGKNYYIWQEVKYSWYQVPHAKLHLVDETEGQKGVLETKLAVPR